jgi:GTPase
VKMIDDDVPTISLTQEVVKQAWTVSTQDGFFIVRGDRIEKFARRTDFSNPHSVNRLRDIMKKMSIFHALEREGAVSDSIIKVGRSQFTLHEQ